MRKTSPVQIIRQGSKITVEMGSTGDVLAVCMIGDDDAVERIADILSSKRLPEDAMALRKLAQDARKEHRVTGL
jgi:hypothetical protein